MVLIVECLKYLYISSVYGGGFIPVSLEIDEVWHKMILQTRYCAKLCEDLPGRRFIHHETLPFAVYSGDRDDTDVVEAFARWIPLYNYIQRDPQ
jgi:hypothetical protein